MIALRVIQIALILTILICYIITLCNRTTLHVHFCNNENMLLFNDRKEAKAFLLDVKNLYRKNGIIWVSDIYSLLNLDLKNRDSCNYGWALNFHPEIRKHNGFYVLVIERAERLTPVSKINYNHKENHRGR